MQPIRTGRCYRGVMDADAALAGRLAEDLDGTFEALVLAHQDRLYSIALRIVGAPADAEELAQDAFVRAHRAMAGYPAERIATLRLRPWLAAIVVNLARNRARRRTLPTGQQGAHEPADERADRPEARHDRAEATRGWARRLAALPPTYRAAVVLRHVDGLSYEEMSDALGRPEGTVKAQVHRGLRLLRAALEIEAAAERRHAEEMTA